VAPILRFIGLLNAAVWLGGMVFFTFIVGPTFFSAEFKTLLTIPRTGAAAQIMVEHYLLVQIWCASIAIGHLILDWLYTGKLFQKSSLFILLFCLGSSVLGSQKLAPRMKELHLIKYAVQTNAQQKADAARSFGILHGAAQVTNLLALAGLLFYYWRLSNANQGGRSGAGARFRS
jgi:hypothetical protein